MTLTSSFRVRTPRRRARHASWPYVPLAFLLVFAVGPLVFVVLTAFKTQSELSERPFALPEHWQWSNFTTAWTQANLAAGLTNSLVVIVGSVAGVCLVGGLAAYSLARLHPKGSGGVVTGLMVGGAMPKQLFLLPLFFIWAQIGLYDSLIGLILVYIAIFSPFATLLLRSFFQALPKELEEAARVDGAGMLRTIFGVVLPVAWPGLLTVALITAINVYHEFLFAVTFLNDETKQPVSTSLYAFQSGYTTDYALLSAAGIVILLPMLVLFLALERRFTEGVAGTGLSGS
ncbi:carbohydrate ABC transporter permease [Streptomyces sp. NPDC047981]|uniref:carbohydrate ABC transporter permease n=1 Tax=Streptomyces sp. NPDC047981 TaxID=3154610 RepID=UPI003448B49B